MWSFPRTRLLVAGLALTIALAPRSAATAEISNDALIRNFDIVAFGNEYTGRRYDHVRKWAQPIRIGIQGAYPPYFEEFVKNHIRDLWKLTGHPIELYYSLGMQKNKQLAKDFDPKKVNFILFYLPVDKIPAAITKYFDDDPRQVEEMIRVSTCFAKFFTRKNEITAGIAVFPAHHPRDYMRACVVEEITQVMGLPNDSPDVSPSIFNDKSRYFELTEQDKWMLRMLYDRRVSFGMTRSETLSIGREILDQKRR